MAVTPLRLDAGPVNQTSLNFIHPNRNPGKQLSARVSSSVPFNLVKLHVPVSIGGYRDSSPFRLPRLQSKEKREAFEQVKLEIQNKIIKGYTTPSGLVSETKAQFMLPISKELANFKNLSALGFQRELRDRCAKQTFGPRRSVEPLKTLEAVEPSGSAFERRLSQF